MVPDKYGYWWFYDPEWMEEPKPVFVRWGPVKRITKDCLDGKNELIFENPIDKRIFDVSEFIDTNCWHGFIEWLDLRNEEEKNG